MRGVERALPLALLGRHVIGRAHDDARAGLVRGHSVGVDHQLGEAEIQHLDEGRVVAVRHEEDVLGLEISVDDAMGVAGRERVGDLRGDAQRALGIEGRLTRDELGEWPALEVLHDEVEVAGGRAAEVGDLDDVLVADAVDGGRLIDEARDDVGVPRVLRVNDLEGGLATDHRMFREVHGTHASLAEQRRDAVIPDSLTKHDHLVPSGRRNCRATEEGRAIRAPSARGTPR